MASGEEVMAHPSLLLAIPAVGLPVALIGYGIYKAIQQAPGHEAAPPEANSPEMKANEKKFTTLGPRGENVFTPDAARGIMGALPGLTYSHPYPDDLSHVQIHPHPYGLPPARGLSAWDWAKSQNRNRSIMAPLYLPTPTGTSKYLRTVPPGHEASLAKQGYGVLMYANTLGRRVPGPPTGTPPAVPRKSAPVPTPVSNAYAELPAELHADFTKMLRGAINPVHGQRLANDFARAGAPNAANVTAANAANTLKQAALGLTKPGSAPDPGPAPAPGWTLNTLTNQWLPPAPPLVSPSLPATPTKPSRAWFPSLDTSVDTLPDYHSAEFQRPAPLTQNANAPGSPGRKTYSAANWEMPVQEVQRRLIGLGFLSATNAKGQRNDDGKLGPVTDFALKKFQQQDAPNSVPGVVDHATAVALVGTGPQAIAGCDRVSGANELGPTLTPPGWAIDVRSAQKMLVALNMLGFFQVSGVPDHPTQQALMTFQASHGLAATGVADDPTAISLRSSTGVSTGKRVRPNWARVRAVIPPHHPGHDDRTSGPPFIPRMNIPMEGVYGPSGMNRYAKIWGHSRWP
jgi:peptidoglycan hydrolase-like protein with peptidoglycan-binding domain